MKGGKTERSRMRGEERKGVKEQGERKLKWR